MALKPRVIEDLNNIRIVDIACGDNHCVSLSAGKCLTVFLLL